MRTVSVVDRYFETISRNGYSLALPRVINQDGHLRKQMQINEEELRKRYGRTTYEEGKALFESGNAGKPRSVGVGVLSVTIEQGYSRTEVLVWDEGTGLMVARTVSGRTFSKAAEVAALIACCGTVSPDAENIPFIYANDPLFQEHLVYGGMENELAELAERIIDDFIATLKKTCTPFGILDSLDVAIDSSYRNREYDTTLLGRSMESHARKMLDTIRETKPSEISRILNSSERIFSRKWLAESRLTDSQAMVAFADLSDRRSLNSYDTAILSALSRKVDPEEYADAVTDELTYYEMERVALRELRRGHRDIAVAISRRFSNARDFDSHLSEAGRLRQEFGLIDNEGIFVRAFLEDPNDKRLLDLVANHPDADLEQLLRTAWNQVVRTPVNLGFFARNGLDEQVARFLSVNEDWTAEHMDEDADSLQLLGEILKDLGQYEASAKLLIKVLEDCLDEKGNENIAAHIMNILDSEYPEAESVLLHYCRNFRSKHRNKALWNLYGSGGHF